MSIFHTIKIDVTVLIESEGGSGPNEILIKMAKNIEKTKGIVDIVDFDVGILKPVRDAQ